MLLEKIKQNIIKNNLIVKGDSIVVGVSGGPDSMCMLHALHQVRDELGITLTAVHPDDFCFRAGFFGYSRHDAQRVCFVRSVAEKYISGAVKGLLEDTLLIPVKSVQLSVFHQKRE